jgi:hypothetical protein
MNIDRRQFVKLTFVITGAAVTGAAGVLGTACSDDPATQPTTGGKDAATGADTSTAKSEAGTDAATAAETGGGVYACRASISQNHGHVIEVPTADLDSTTPKTYSIKGTSPHAHNVVLDADDFAALKSGISVKKTSDANGETHDHEVNILCATI